MILVLSFSSFINWDNIIAQYNFSHSHKSFVHLDYLSGLSDKSLPYLDKSMNELTQINTLQKQNFPYEHEYQTPEEYYYIIKFRKSKFNQEWESKSILSWNFAEYIAYRKLKRNQDN